MFAERQRCPACGETASETLWNSPFSWVGGFIRDHYGLDPHTLNAPYRLDECCACGLVFQRFIGTAETLTTLYSQWVPSSDPWDVASYRADMADMRGSRDAHELMTVSAYLGKPLPEMRVLDYGMGWGLWATIARNLGCAAYGVELSPQMAAHATALGVEVLDTPQGYFDFINLEQVIEHVPEPLKLIESLDGTIIKLSLPNAAKARAIIEQIRAGRCDYETIMPVQPLEHINSFSPPTLKRMAALAGYQVVKPSIAQRYAFLRYGLPKGGKRILKELLRPFWTYTNPENIYVWLRRP